MLFCMLRQLSIKSLWQGHSGVHDIYELAIGNHWLNIRTTQMIMVVCNSSFSASTWRSCDQLCLCAHVCVCVCVSRITQKLLDYHNILWEDGLYKWEELFKFPDHSRYRSRFCRLLWVLVDQNLLMEVCHSWVAFSFIWILSLKLLYYYFFSSIFSLALPRCSLQSIRDQWP